MTVSTPGLTNPGGTVTIQRGATTVKSGVAVSNGRAVVTLGSQPKGAQKYRAIYSGTAKALSSVSAYRSVTVRR